MIAVSWHLVLPANSTKTCHADDGKDMYRGGHQAWERALSMVGVEEGREFRFRGDLYSQ